LRASLAVWAHSDMNSGGACLLPRGPTCGQCIHLNKVGRRGGGSKMTLPPNPAQQTPLLMSMPRAAEAAAAAVVSLLCREPDGSPSSAYTTNSALTRPGGPPVHVVPLTWCLILLTLEAAHPDRHPGPSRQGGLAHRHQTACLQAGRASSCRPERAAGDRSCTAVGQACPHCACACRVAPHQVSPVRMLIPRAIDITQHCRPAEHHSPWRSPCRPRPSRLSSGGPPRPSTMPSSEGSCSFELSSSTFKALAVGQHCVVSRNPARA